MRACFNFIFFILLIFSIQTFSIAAQLSIDLEDVLLPDAIQAIAKLMQINVVISPSVKGAMRLHLNNAHPEDALALLLSSNGLAKCRRGNIWLIAPHDELIKIQQAELKWHEAQDAAMHLETKTWRIKYGKAEEIAKMLQDVQGSLLSSRGKVRVDARTNILCVQEIPQHLFEITRLIRMLDVPVKQLLIDARLASVDSDCERELGIYFGAKSNKTDTNLSSATEGHYSIAIAKLADGSILDVKLAALENAGRAELISSPSLFTANQQAASIEAGEEVPYQEVSRSGGTAVVFKKAVLGLKVIPQVLPDNRVLLDLLINQDRPSSRMVLGMPTITTRQIKTTVIVKPGQTVVLGGVYENNREKGEQRLPFISQIPLIGYLFMQQHVRVSKRELLIFVTPRVVS